MKINKNLWFLIIPIFCIALITGSFFYTRGIIKANEAAKANGVISDVFPDAVRYSEATYNKRFLALYLEEQGYETTDVVVDHVVYARNEQNAVKGLIVYVNCYKNFGGLIQMAVGIQNNGTINGYTILDISDAKGLESQVKEDDFKNQFIGKNVSAFVLSDEPHNDAEIEAPNGARDASGTVVNGINTAIITLEFIDESMGGLLE